jgi:mono/diheme cytochrome c family protein
MQLGRKRYPQPTSDHMYRYALTLALAASACVLYTPSVAGAQSKTTAKKSAVKTTSAAKPAAKPAASATVAAKEQLPDGKQVFSTTCAACHQATGEGVAGVYPPLAGSEWVNGEEAKAVRILLHGVTGPIEVAGETFNSMMPPWGATLKDADIAAVLTYVRSTWGNKGTPITAATVAKIRAATASRTTPWTAAELAGVK